MAKKARKQARREPASVKIQGPLPRLTLNMPLDEKRVRAIQRCIDKGTLKITVNKIDLSTGKLGDGWLYD